MLCLGRKVNERIVCERHGERFLEIVVLRAGDGKVRLGLVGDREVSIMRAELLEESERDAGRPIPVEAACDEIPELPPLSIPVPKWYADLPTIGGE